MIKKLKLRNQYADEEFVWSVFAQLVTALYRCHYGEDPPEVGRNVMGIGRDAKPIKSKQSPYMILHRDLKPENGKFNCLDFCMVFINDGISVFLDADNSVKLGDFGLSKILQSHDFASTYVGTPFYMSPEICAAERYSLYSDIWSLGCIIYELCTKEPPFNARTHIDLFHKIKAGRVSPLPPVYSAELQKVINSCLQVNPNSRPDTAQLLNLPVVKLMRKEQEVVSLGKKLKNEKEQADRRIKEVDEKLAKMEAERELMKSELDASVRREWEVKARLEIDRQVELETERLKKLFETEVIKRVAAEVEQILQTGNDSSTNLKRSSTPAPDERHTRPTAQPAPANTASFSTTGTDSDFPSQTDLSSLSLESPFSSKPQPMKRSSRTPFIRAHTVNNIVAPSPMDITMADPSPTTIASLALSPRRDGVGKTAQRPKSNIFTEGEVRWRPTNASSFPTPSASEDEFDESGEPDDDDEDELPVLPSPSRDPFKVLNKRPSLTRQRTLPANNKRLASAPNLFARNNVTSGANVKRPASAVPVIATSPQRKGAASPIAMKTTKVPMPVVSEAGSPIRKKTTDVGLRPKKNDGMIKTAMRNQLNGRTLVELAQGRAGGTECEKPENENHKTNVKISKKEAPLWDPERDEMPSPFLVRGSKVVRSGQVKGDFSRERLQRS
jgi:NIMA (never in mitosis gene a)-related kinase